MRVALSAFCQRQRGRIPALKKMMRVLLLGGLVAPFAGVTTSGGSDVATPGPAETQPTEIANAPLELRGIVFTESGYLFGIYYPSSRQSAWVALGQRRGDLIVQSHDVANDSIVAEFQGHTIKLAMKTSKMENIPAVSTADALTPSQVSAVKTEVERRKKLRLESKKARLQRALAK